MVKKTSKSNSPQMPEVIYAEASVRAIGGKSLFDTNTIVNSDTVDQYSSKSQLVQAARDLRR